MLSEAKMKKIIKNKYLSKGIRIVIITVIILAILVFTFLQGMFYANKKATVRIANDNCFSALNALKGFDKPSYGKFFRPLFERELEISSKKLADMCLKYPNYIQRNQYDLLISIKEYQKNVDPKVDKAIKYTESIHDMKTWGVFDIHQLIEKE